ncbi:MAG: hypothetical protein IT310_02585 [Anaerolineales bacterium]|nr:hypothetical protein [Anaerolineales bacterium]
MGDSYNDQDFTVEDEEAPAEESNNRTFLIVAGILGGVILITAICLGAVLFFRNFNKTTTPDPVALTATAQVQNGAISEALTATFQASILPTTTVTPLPTNTPVVAVASETPTPDPGALDAGNVQLTSTIAAAFTQAAAAQLTIVPTTTALPNTGFLDDYGLPGMLAMTVAFVIVILLARRLRVTPASRK